ncbi:unnamed protein product, partial [Rotaria sp. Silwood2]
DTPDETKDANCG